MTDKIYISVDGIIQEAKGEVLEQILKDRENAQKEKIIFETKQESKQATLESAIAKLSKLGLTEDEAKAVIGLQ